MAIVRLELAGYSQAVELCVDEDELVEIKVNGTVVAAIDPRSEQQAASIGTWLDVPGQEHYVRCVHISKALGMPEGEQGPVNQTDEVVTFG